MTGKLNPKKMMDMLETSMNNYEIDLWKLRRAIQRRNYTQYLLLDDICRDIKTMPEDTMKREDFNSYEKSRGYFRHMAPLYLDFVKRDYRAFKKYLENGVVINATWVIHDPSFTETVH